MSFLIISGEIFDVAYIEWKYRKDRELFRFFHINL